MRKFIPIGEAAKILGLHPQTLRFYEKEGLIKPLKRRGRRYFSAWELEWVRCLREMMKQERLSMKSMKKMLQFVPCWKIKGCGKRNCHMWGKRWRLP